MMCLRLGPTNLNSFSNTSVVSFSSSGLMAGAVRVSDAKRWRDEEEGFVGKRRKGS